MDDFKTLLERQVKKAAGAPVVSLGTTPVSGTGREIPIAPRPKAEAAPPEVHPEPGTQAPIPGMHFPEAGDSPLDEPDELPVLKAPDSEPGAANPRPVSRLGGGNLNRVTVNLFDADRRALAVIKEKLGSQGHDFTNRSDSIKIGLRLAMKASREDLAAVYEQVKAEDRRFRPAI